ASLAACGAGGGTDRTTGNQPAGATSPTARATAVGLTRIGTFSSPLYLTASPGDSRRLFVVNQRGTIDEVLDGRKLGTPFLDLSDQVSCCGERGLLSMAF